jgi:hypothetical protein
MEQVNISLPSKEELSMSSSPYSIARFLSSIRDENYEEMIRSADSAVQNVESRSYGVKGAPRARQQGSVEYAMALKRFLNFMGTGNRPGGITDWEFQLYRPICEALVQKGRFRPEVFKMFDRA